MKKRNAILLAALACASVFACNAQTGTDNDYPWTRGRRKPAGEKATVTDLGTRAMPERIDLRLGIGLDDVSLRRNQELVVRPALIEGRDTLFLPPVDVYGKIRYKYDERTDFLYGKRQAQQPAYKVVVLGRERPENLIYDLSVPADPSLYGRELAVVQDLYGCAGSHVRLGTDRLGRLTPPRQPVVAFIIAPAPRPQVREDRLTAHVDFPFDRADLRPDFRDNRRELQRIDSMTAGIAAAPGVRTREITMVGYASPEGPWSYNDGLSQRRVRTIGKYVEDNHGLEGVDISNVAEDWDGVRRWVENSDLKHRDEVLDIIASVDDPDARDRAIRSLDGGATYRRLLREAYPPLRRVDYRIRYDIAPRTAESAAEIFRISPDSLTVYELYMVADSYPAGSDDYATVWTEIVRIYPDDHLALHNAAASAMSCGDYETARGYVEKERDCPEKLNNLGVLAFADGDYRAAERYFEKAAEAGCPEAAANLKDIYHR